METDKISIQEKTVREISLPLYSSKGWIKLLGVIMLIYGVILALSLFGIIIAWVPIWIGILLMQTAGRINEAQITGNKEALIKAQNSLRIYFTVYGVLALVALIVAAITIIVLLSTGALTHLEDFRNEYYLQ